jgi:predicted nucleic acid-binding Zn ribbon protein
MSERGKREGTRRDRMRKRPAPRPLASALESLAGSLQPAGTLARVQSVWEQAAGPALAAAGRPSSEHDGVLTVVCADSMWASEIELMGGELLERINAALGEQAIRRVRCRSG